MSYPQGDDTDSLNMKNTLNDRMSDNTFDVPHKKQIQNRSRSRVQSAQYGGDHIEEIQEEAFDSINIKT